METRHLLASETARIAVDADAPLPSFVVADPRGDLASVVGTPAPELIRSHAGRVGGVLAYPDNVEHVRRVLVDHAVDAVHVHVLRHPLQVPAPDGDARLIRPRRRGDLTGVPAELAEELLEVAAEGIPIGAALADRRAVAFCYPAARSERWWDISIDTLQSHRRQGFARTAVLFMIRHMAQTTGLDAVWCSAHGNPASTALALRLGFIEVDRIRLLSATGTA